MLDVTEMRGHYEIKQESFDPRVHADLSSIPGKTYDSTTGVWRVSKSQVRAVRAVRALLMRWEDRYRVREGGWGNKPPLYDHQIAGLRFVQEHPSTLLDMYMATGKTRLGVELIDFCQAQRVLIVGPVGALPVWRDQLAQFARYSYQLLQLKNMDSVTVRADKLSKYEDDKGLTYTPTIVLVNYEAVWRPPLSAVIRQQTWDMVIADECHRLKSPGSKVSRFFGQLAPYVPFRIGLSGTPLAHSIMDVYGIYRFLQPSIFGTNYKKFKNSYTITNPYTYQIEDYINMDTFRAKYALIRYHVPKEMLKIEKPVFSTLPIALSPQTWKVYKEVEEEFYAELDEERRVDAPNVLVKYLRLQQIESGYVPIDGTTVSLPGGEAKMKALLSFLEDFPIDEKLVVFARFKEEIGQIITVAKEVDRSVKQITGQKKELDEWKKTPGAVLAVNLAAGSEAIDLTDAGFAIFYSLSYKLSEYEQAVARVNRPGQRSAPQIYVMIPEGPNGERSLGHSVFRALQERRNLLDVLLKGVE